MKRIFTYICILCSSLLVTVRANAQNQAADVTGDTIPLFRNLAVSVDVAGPVMLMIGDYGDLQASVRVNLKDKFFPTLELGYGIGRHEDDIVTGTGTETKAPFGRIGMDFNVKKNKHDKYRLLAGVRYGYSQFDMKLWNNTIVDPVWGISAPVNVKHTGNYCHWLEGVFSADAQIAGPLRIGWSVRYRRHIASSDTPTGALWYIPGFGTYEKAKWSGMFNLTFEI